MQLYTVYLYLETATCFGWYHHPSSGALLMMGGGATRNM